MLDSWVRYEGKIQKELENPKTLQQILQQSVADVESEQPDKLMCQVSADACSTEIVSSKAQ